MKFRCARLPSCNQSWEKMIRNENILFFALIVMVYTAKNIAFLPHTHCHWMHLKILMLIPFPVLRESVWVRPPVLKLRLWSVLQHRLRYGLCSHFLFFPSRGWSPWSGSPASALKISCCLDPSTCSGPLARCWPPVAFPVSPLLCFFSSRMSAPTLQNCLHPGRAPTKCCVSPLHLLKMQILTWADLVLDWSGSG